MRAVDTNVLARLFVMDDAAQLVAARQAMAADSIFVPKTVMIELEWVLRSGYGQSRTTIVAAIETILATANVEVEDAAAVARAVDWLRRGMDFADALHLASSRHADAFVSFDVAMRRRASTLGVKPPVVTP
jgi:predicted nucleic-acid-binding protein